MNKVNARTSQLAEEDMPVGFVSYSVIATDAKGGMIPDPIWGSDMPVLADGFLDIEDAKAQGQEFLVGYVAAAGFYVRESVRVDWRREGHGWKPGRTVLSAKRTRAQIIAMATKVKRELGPSPFRPNGAPEAFVAERLAPLKAEYKAAEA